MGSFEKGKGAEKGVCEGQLSVRPVKGWDEEAAPTPRATLGTLRHPRTASMTSPPAELFLVAGHADRNEPQSQGLPCDPKDGLLVSMSWVGGPQEDPKEAL